MNTFEYFPAKTVKEACDLLSQYGEEAKILGGGQSLVTLMKQNLVSPSYLIDIKDISELDYIRYDDEDGLRIGALTTHRSLETSEIVSKPLKEIRFPEGAMLASIIREDSITIPTGESIVKPGDRIIIFARRDSIPKIEKMLSVKLEFF